MLFYNRTTQAFESFWLLAHPAGWYWVKTGDSALSNRNARVLVPTEGWFSQCRGPEVKVTMSGHVKAHGVACPLVAGVQMVAPGWPVGTTPAAALMDEVNGFKGGANSGTADQILTWKGDGVASATGYESYYLLGVSTFRQWIRVGDGSVANQNQTQLLNPYRSIFLRSRLGKPSWVIPRGWTP